MSLSMCHFLQTLKRVSLTQDPIQGNSIEYFQDKGLTSIRISRSSKSFNKMIKNFHCFKNLKVITIQRKNLPNQEVKKEIQEREA